MEKIWEERKNKLKQKGWTYDKEHGQWCSAGGSAEWVEDLKLMTEKQFEFCLGT